MLLHIFIQYFNIQKQLQNTKLQCILVIKWLSDLTVFKKNVLLQKKKKEEN